MANILPQTTICTAQQILAQDIATFLSLQGSCTPTICYPDYADTFLNSHKCHDIAVNERAAPSLRWEGVSVSGNVKHITVGE